MKSLILTATALLVCFTAMFAQTFPPDLNWEMGINGGYSIATRPEGPDPLYCGTKTSIVHDYSIRGAYSFSPNWQLTLDVGDRKWESYGYWPIIGSFGKTLPSQMITFTVANHAISESFQMNYVIPFFTKFQVYNKANFYFGVMLGMVNSVNDGSLAYSTYKSKTDSGYIYMSKFDYGFGIGWSYGVQTGFSYYFVPKLGINAEIAIRTANVGTNDYRNNHDVGGYSLLYFPATIGIRYKF